MGKRRLGVGRRLGDRAEQDRREGRGRRQEDVQFQKLIEVGLALSAETNHERLMESILVEAKGMCHADGGTLYLKTEEDDLSFAIMLNDTMKIAMGGTTGVEIPFPPLPLYDGDSGEPNHHNVATHVALDGNSVNVTDAYETDDFDFSGAKKFDADTGYRSQSFLTVPLKNYGQDVIGVLQLINARDAKTGEVGAFDVDLQPIIEALASQAAVALDNQLLLDKQRKLLESFIQVIASAIDAKSPYTGGHCQRVPVIAEMLAAAACDSESGPFRDFALSEDEQYELYIASWLHDCGKVTTPEYVVDKATKLETIYDRIETVKTRLEVLKRDAEIAYLKAATEPGADAESLRAEFMADEMIERVQEIAALSWRDASGQEQPFLSENEVDNLCIKRGTLTDEEREVINNHIVMTIEMLEQLPFPKTLVRVPVFAGGHHEKLDGTGYPQGLTGEQMSLPARMMAIADIFEALTAADRPYKKAKTLTESLRIMSFMVKDQHIDAELFRLFLEGGVYQRYAEAHLLPEQIDDVSIADYLG